MFCRCEMRRDVVRVVSDVNLYPQAGVLACGKMLMDVKHVPWGQHFWDEAMREPYGVRKMELSRAPTIPIGWGYIIQLFFMGKDSEGVPIPCSWICRGFGCRERKSLLAHLWIIQRAIRGAVTYRRQKRALCMMMGTHERLGEACLIASIPTDIWRTHILKIH
jgi:hypothetical protein